MHISDECLSVQLEYKRAIKLARNQFEVRRKESMITSIMLNDSRRSWKDWRNMNTGRQNSLRESVSGNSEFGATCEGCKEVFCQNL